MMLREERALLGGPDRLVDISQMIAWAGFLGAWLLVAGPLYQGALELREEDVDREGIEASTGGAPRPDPPSRGGGYCRRSCT
jgi:hypothetical protein